MKKMKKLFKTLTVIALVFGFFFAPIFGSAKAMSYNYDFWKNIIPSAEGIAHKDTFYAENIEYHKNDKYELLVEQLNKLLDDLSLSDIKAVVSNPNYKEITTDDYNNAIIALDAKDLTDAVKQQVKELINEKQEYEADPNLYKSINFNTITDIQVYGDYLYVLSTPTAMEISNITGTSKVAELTQLIIINKDMKWETCINEFEITESVRDSFDNYYQWNRLGFSSVATGKNHTVAVDTSGNIWAWGSNEYGQLGIDPALESLVAEPKQITWIGDENARSYTKVFATDYATFALDSSNQLWAFGKNDNHLISASQNTDYHQHELIKIELKDTIIEVNESKDSDDNTIYDVTKTEVTGTAKVVSVADDHIYVIDSENRVWAWGDNTDKLLQVVTTELVEDSNGKVEKVNKVVEDSIKSPRLTTINLTREDKYKLDSEGNPTIINLKPVDIQAGPNHTLIVDDEASLWAWGSNEYGQLGLGNFENKDVPTAVELKKNNVKVGVTSIAVGENHTALVDKLGGLWTFGSNSHCQLGLSEDTLKQENPYAYRHSNIEYTKVFAFGNTTYAIDMEYQSYVFGQNTDYQLGFTKEDKDSSKLPYTKNPNNISLTFVANSGDATFGIDSSNRLWIWGTSDTKLGFGSTDDIVNPKYSDTKLDLNNIAISRLENSDIYKRAIYVAHSKDSTKPAVYLRSAAGIAVDENFIYIADTQNSRILKVNKLTYVVEDVCLTPANTTFKQLYLDSTVLQDVSLRQFKPTKITVSPTGRVYAIAEQVYEGIIEFNKQGDYNRYLGQNDVVTNPLKEMLREYLTEEQLASFALTLPPLFTSISTDTKGFIYATSYPDTESGTVTGQNMVKAINTSGKDCMKRNGYVAPNGDAVYISSSQNSKAILGPSYLVDVAVNKDGNFTVVDEVRGRLFTYDLDGNLLYIAGDQPGGTKQNASGLSENIIKPVAIDYMYRSYTNADGETINDQLIIVADQQSKSLMYYETTEFGRLVNEATAAYNRGVDTREEAIAVRAIWEEVRQRNTNYELAYLGIGKCILVESDYVEGKTVKDITNEQLKLYQEAMQNFRLAHSGTYYSKAFGRYRDQILSDNFSWIMTAAVIIAVGIAGWTVYKTIKAKQAKKIKVQGGSK